VSKKDLSTGASACPKKFSRSDSGKIQLPTFHTAYEKCENLLFSTTKKRLKGKTYLTASLVSAEKDRSLKLYSDC
jgi:hypothetical protein